MQTSCFLDGPRSCQAKYCCRNVHQQEVRTEILNHADLHAVPLVFPKDFSMNELKLGNVGSLWWPHSRCGMWTWYSLLRNDVTQSSSQCTEGGNVGLSTLAEKCRGLQWPEGRLPAVFPYESFVSVHEPQLLFQLPCGVEPARYALGGSRPC